MINNLNLNPRPLKTILGNAEDGICSVKCLNQGTGKVHTHTS
jgi:hypothetical protein